jgi:hypothetical protein
MVAIVAVSATVLCCLLLCFFLYSNVFLIHSSANDVFLKRSGPLTQQHKIYLCLIVFGLLLFFFIASAVHCHFDDFGTATTRVMVVAVAEAAKQPKHYHRVSGIVWVQLF